MKLNLSGELIPSDWAEIYRRYGYASGFYCPDDVRNAINNLEPGEELLLEVNSIGGSVFAETIFSIPGMGRLFYEAVMARDYPVVMALVTIGAVLTMLGNLLADVAYAYADPRIRVGTKS